MAQSTIDQALQNALQHHQAGRLAEAEPIYRQILAQSPDHADATHLLGLIAHQVGRNDLAVELIRKAISIQPNDPTYHSNLAEVFRCLGRPDEAAAAASAAIQLKADYVEAYCTLGAARQSQGKLDDAIAAYSRAIQLKPDYIQAYNNLGSVLQSQGKLNEAIAAYSKAIQLRPDYADGYSNLGNALRCAGKFDEAVAACSKAIQLRPNFAEALINLGIAVHSQGKLDEAVAAYSKAIQVKPDYAEAHNNLGTALQSQGKLNEALVAHSQAIQLRPNFAEAYYNLGGALRSLGKLDEAVAAYSRAIQLMGDYPAAYNNLGNVLRLQDRLDEAAAAYSKAIQLKPDFAEAYSNLGIILRSQDKFDEAAAHHSKAIELKPDYADAYSNLANTLKDMGDIEEAIVLYERALAINPNHGDAVGNRLFCLYYHPGYDSASILEAQRAWNQRYAEPLRARITPHVNFPAPDRRLRIGYVSPDFRDHVVGRNLLPLLREHDHGVVEVICYADVMRLDGFSERFRAHADGWQNIIALSDEQVAEQVRRDRIDILVDLTLHSGKNRLLVFARKPAPVQVTFAGYPGGTGLAAMDYRLTDPWLDAADVTDRDYVEQSIRLPDSFWCYDPQAMMADIVPEPQVGPLPALENKHITFGCLNNFCKVNPQCLVLWAEVLRAVKNSRLLLLAAEGSHRRRTLDRLEREGIEPTRVEFLARVPRTQYLQYYHRIDIGLDTLPYNGHTTSLDAYWMGVPVITQMGRTVVARAGFSQLTNLGLSELVARTPGQYVQIAKDLASDLPRLVALRAALRERVRQSPLADAKRFARNIEAAYRQMWQRWCEGRVGNK